LLASQDGTGIAYNASVMEGTKAGGSSVTARLRYLNATRLEGPVPRFDRLVVLNSEGRRVGRLDGIIIDPAQRRVRYLVVDDSGFFKHHRYLLPLAPTRVDTERPALRVDIDSADLTRCEDFDPAAFPRFSDDDLLVALFAGDQLESATPA
jgi:sporulation protein YlmC with PRC-barrel domain